MFAVRFGNEMVGDAPKLEESHNGNCQRCKKSNLRVWITINENSESWCDNCMKGVFKIFKTFRSEKTAIEYLEALEVVEAL